MLYENFSKLPGSIAIIMDGNRRWARLNDLPDIEGYRKGVDSLYKVLSKSLEIGIQSIIVYAFSAENTLRQNSEVGALFRFMISQLESTSISFFLERGIRVSFIGDLQIFPDALVKLARSLQEKTFSCDAMHLGIALNYGARQELFRASLELLKSSGEVGSITESDFVKCLYTKDFQNIDLLIRSGGEKRLSNFLLWNLAYSELYFCDVLWPDFTEEEFLLALCDYGKRSRRYGK